MGVRKSTLYLSPCLLLAAMGGAGQSLAADAFSADSKWLTGDWGGLRTEWLEKGYDIQLEHGGEFASNLKGGYNDDKTARWTEQFVFGLKVDLQKAMGIEHATFKMAITERDGRSLTNDRITDPRVGGYTSSQEVYGRGQTWRLTQLWLSKGFLDDGALDIKVGRFGPGEDFNSFPCDFQSLTFCGSQVGNWAGSIWFNWPVSQLAGRVKYSLNPEVFVQVGAYNQNPSNLEVGNGFKLDGSGTKGTIFPVELVWSPKVQGLPGEYRVGYYYSTASANDVLKDVNGQPQPLTGDGFKSHTSKSGYWLVAQQQITSHNGDASRGLSLFANLTLHDKDTNQVDNFIQAGMVYTGLFDSRPKDAIGFGVARVHTNSDYRERAQLQNQVNGATDYNDPASIPLQHSEYSSEVYYGFHVTNWLTVRPNLQYVRYPGGVREVDSAVIGGIKVETVF
ncbi:carbohydrate porin [Pseudomonas sp. NPDC087697]|uniref:carbohydrate porin n=1 Tax=Pseudomonas sp. NPDC087697 TaxID=3364447 RepID=UPI00380B95E4